MKALPIVYQNKSKTLGKNTKNLILKKSSVCYIKDK